MKIFITGIAGFLGGHVAENLLAAGHEVSGCDNLIGGYLDNVPEDADFYQVDVSQFSKGIYIVSFNTFESVVYKKTLCQNK